MKIEMLTDDGYVIIPSTEAVKRQEKLQKSPDYLLIESQNLTPERLKQLLDAELLFYFGGHINGLHYVFKQSVLHSAIINPKCIEYLCENFANINLNSRDSQGATPAHHAASTTRFGSVLTLYENGADLTLTDNLGVSVALQCIVDHKFPHRDTRDIIMLLATSGLWSNNPDSRGRTPFDVLMNRKVGLDQASILTLALQYDALHNRVSEPKCMAITNQHEVKRGAWVELTQKQSTNDRQASRCILM